MAPKYGVLTSGRRRNTKKPHPSRARLGAALKQEPLVHYTGRSPNLLRCSSSRHACAHEPHAGAMGRCSRYMVISVSFVGNYWNQKKLTQARPIVTSSQGKWRRFLHARRRTKTPPVWLAELAELAGLARPPADITVRRDLSSPRTPGGAAPGQERRGTTRPPRPGTVPRRGPSGRPCRTTSPSPLPTGSRQTRPRPARRRCRPP